MIFKFACFFVSPFTLAQKTVNLAQVRNFTIFWIGTAHAQPFLWPVEAGPGACNQSCYYYSFFTLIGGALYNCVCVCVCVCACVCEFVPTCVCVWKVIQMLCVRSFTHKVSHRCRQYVLTCTSSLSKSYYIVLDWGCLQVLCVCVCVCARARMCACARVCVYVCVCLTRTSPFSESNIISPRLGVLTVVCVCVSNTNVIVYWVSY